MAEQATTSKYLELTAEIVSAYVANNSLPQSDLTVLLGAVHGALNRTAKGETQERTSLLTPAVPSKKSITPDYIVCLEDGKSSSRSSATFALRTA